MRASFLSVLISGSLAVPVAAQETVDPWAVLAAARNALVAASPLEAEFLQTFTPAGFSTGDTEGGRLYLALPDCLRWDYRDPFPRSYLICDGIVHIWSPGDSEGRRLHVDRTEEPGLDLLLLSVEALQQRYRATLGPTGEGDFEVVLLPTGSGASFSEAAIVIEPSTSRPRVIRYVDQEGNASRFDLSSYAPDGDEGRFVAPPITWQDG